jgi:hypothetical protein
MLDFGDGLLLGAQIRRDLTDEQGARAVLDAWGNALLTLRLGVNDDKEENYGRPTDRGLTEIPPNPAANRVREAENRRR